MSDYDRGLALEAAQEAVLQHAYRRNGDMLVCDPATLDTPLQRVLSAEDDVKELMQSLDPGAINLLEVALEQRLDELILQTRRRAFQVLMDWLVGGHREAPKNLLPRNILKRFFAFARVVCPDHIARMNQSEIAKLLGETRAAACEREKQEVEAFFRLWMEKEYTASGGKKSSSRRRFSRDKRGNLSRKGGRKVEHIFGHRHAEPEMVRRGDMTPERVRALEDEAECRRVAALAGVDPDEVSIEVLRDPIPEEEFFNGKKRVGKNRG